MVGDTKCVEKRLSDAICKYGAGRISTKEAEKIASENIHFFLDGCEKSLALRSKGIDWFAREIVKSM